MSATEQYTIDHTSETRQTYSGMPKEQGRHRSQEYVSENNLYAELHM